MLSLSSILEITILLIIFGLYIKSTENRNYKNTPKNILWINGTHSLLTKTNDWDIKIFGGMKKNRKTEAFCKKVLEGSYEITRREELLQTIQELTDGHDNNNVLKVIESDKTFKTSREEFESIMQSKESSNVVTYYKSIYNAYEKFGDKAVLGWDLSRATSLYSLGYVAGFFTYKDATTKAIEVGKYIQSTFDSWDSFFESYMYGYELWSESDVLDPNSAYNIRVRILEDFKKDQNSFYYLDWNLDLDKK